MTSPSPTPSSGDGPGSLAGRLAAGGLLAAGVLASRAVLLDLVDTQVYGLADGGLVRWRIAGELRGDLPWVLGLALCGALVARGRPAAAGVSAVRRVGAGLASTLGLTLLVWLGLVGAPWAADFHRLDRVAGGELLHHAALAGLALGLGAVGLVALRIGTAVTGGARGPVRLAVAAAGLGLAALAPTGYGAFAGVDAPLMQTSTVRRTIAFDSAAWQVRESHPEAAPYLAVLSPSKLYQTDSADLPSLVMPPPCEVAFTVTEEDGEVEVRIAAGADESVGNRSTRRAPLRFAFEVLVNGESRFAAETENFREQPTLQKFWRRPEVPLRLSPGDEVVLRTRRTDVDAETAKSQPPQRVGFGEVALVARERRPRLRSTARTPNVLVIVQDTQRADRLSQDGYFKPTTPHLDRLARRGLRHSEAYATASWTWPATASILTGLTPDAHGVTDDSSCYLSPENTTVAEALQARGYSTGAFTRNPLIVPEKNFHQGFEHFENPATGGGPVSFPKTDLVLPDIRRWLTRHAGVRFFLYLHLVDPHAPHRPREVDLARLGGTMPDDLPPGDSTVHEYNSKLLQGKGLDENGELIDGFIPDSHVQWFSDLYDACVASGDHYVGEILGYLDELGLTDETIVVFTSDHGEEWLDHGTFTHGQKVHRELVRVPLVLAGPGIPEGVTSDVPISNRHIAFTAARFGGADLGEIPDGVNLATPRPESSREDPVFYGTTHGFWNGRRGRQPIYGVRRGDWVLHFAPEGTDYGVRKQDADSEGQCKLYDVASDPLEMVDMAAEHPALVAELKKVVLDRLASDLALRGTRQTIGAGGATADMLAEIGYAFGGEEGEQESGGDSRPDHEPGGGGAKGQPDEGAGGAGLTDEEKTQ